MEQFPQPENQKESGINRVVGFGPELEEEFLDYFKKRFDGAPSPFKELLKTPEQEEIIGRINEEMKDFLKRYGVDAIDIPSKNIHILDRRSFTEEEIKAIEEKFGTKHGFYSAANQAIAILKDYEWDKLSFCQTIVHEMLHLQGFYSYQKSDPGESEVTLKKGGEKRGMNIRRSGFSMGTRDGNKLFFHEVNESIITELEIRFDRAYINVETYPELQDEIKAREEYRQELIKKGNMSVTEVESLVASNRKYSSESFPYHRERKEFNRGLDALYEQNKTDFETREEVFNLLVDATLRGRVLPVARLIKKTFGEDMFRVVGEDTASVRKDKNEN